MIIEPKRKTFQCIRIGRRTLTLNGGAWSWVKFIKWFKKIKSELRFHIDGMSRWRCIQTFFKKWIIKYGNAPVFIDVACVDIVGVGTRWITVERTLMEEDESVLIKSFIESRIDSDQICVPISTCSLYIGTICLSLRRIIKARFNWTVRLKYHWIVQFYYFSN